jgi:hypothetical protein
MKGMWVQTLRILIPQLGWSIWLALGLGQFNRRETTSTIHFLAGSYPDHPTQG